MSKAPRDRRPKRQRHELPDPSRSPKAHVNRMDTPNPTYSSKIAPKIKSAADAFRGMEALSKKGLTEQALLAFMYHYASEEQPTYTLNDNGDVIMTHK